MRKQLTYQAPPSLAIAEGAVVPNPGQSGVEVWSSVTGQKMVWTGALWTALLSGQYALTEQAPIVTMTATGTAVTGACEYGGFHVRAISGTPQTVTVYDATSATGTPIHTESVSVTGYSPWSGSRLRPNTTGCHVVISGGTSRTIDVIVG